ncbi:hypothetical protein, partial [Microvirga zambiensis]|uniref:hypothetical protein n=1 Tax=Microvirga zambiensis TaxID=1402137 RepID=UPI001AEF5B03
DEVPDNAGHLVAVELDDRIGYLDLRHDLTLRFRAENSPACGRMVAGAIARLSPGGKVGTPKEFSAFWRVPAFSIFRCTAPR